ncbi:MAG: hypothetical protein JKY15_01910 [Deltaproteobacteria bacterium]|nr:hypothetical protein [Deltaproteobacteria bacterium]
MSLQQNFTKILGHQEITVNPNNNSIILEITDPFKVAGRELGWRREFGWAGFGINKSIMSYLYERNNHGIESKLLILISSKLNEPHWISCNKIKLFRKFNPSLYNVSGNEIIVLPMKIFTSKPTLEVNL